MNGRLALVLGVAVALALFFVLRPPPDRDPAVTPSTARAASAIPGAVEHTAAGGLFQDVTATSGITFRHRLADGRMDTLLESVGSGAVCLDYDGDGYLDIYFLQQSAREGITKVLESTPTQPPLTNALYRNRGDGTFEDVTKKAGVGDAGFSFSAAAADYDADGDTDLFVFNSGPNRLYRNRGDGTFEAFAAQAGIDNAACAVDGTLFDADGDGDLDLYVANYVDFDPDYDLHYAPDGFPGPLAFAAQPDVLYINQGDGTFLDGTEQAGLTMAPGRAMGVVAADFDADGRVDVFVANDASANFLLHNEGGGRFKEVGQIWGVAYGFHGEATGAMAGTVGDVDGNGRPDLLVTDMRYSSLYCNLGPGLFKDRCYGAGIAALAAQWVSWGGGFFDFDNDGDEDVYLANGDSHHPTGRPDLLLENQGAGSFVDASRRGGSHFHRELLTRAGCIADFDNDGRLDVLLTHIDDAPILLRNAEDGKAHWITLALRPRGGAGEAFGAVVEVEAGGRMWRRLSHAPSGYLSQNDPRLHFGLGDAKRVERVTVLWAGGHKQVFENLAPDRIHILNEGARGQ